LQRYLDEFSFRYNNRVRLGVDDIERAALAIKGAEGKRLPYVGGARHRAMQSAGDLSAKGTAC
jgi:hypothetical protein